MRRLIVNPGTENAWEIPLPTGIATVGREPGNDLVIDHPSISSRHCEFMAMDSGVTIKDLGSANGTFIDGHTVSESAWLPGQLLQLGEVQVQLEQSAAAPVVSSTPSGPVHCKYHPRSPARYLCPQCHLHFCEACVSTRATASQTKHVCRTCAVECTPVAPTETAVEITDLPFSRQIIGAFQYPLKGDGIMIIAVGTIFFLLIHGAMMAARFAPIYGITAVGMLTVFGTGYLFAYLRRILNASALGEDVMPEWPEMTGIVNIFYEFLGTVLFCFGPAIGLTCYAIYSAVHGSGDGDSAWLGWATMSAIFLGCVYFPMAFMAVAMFDSIGAVNPLLVIPSIIKVLKEYVLTVIMLALILVLRWLLNNYLGNLLPIRLLSTSISSLLGLYLLIVEMRILGLLYRNKKYELGWFT